jgi:hypothetical protein
VVTDASTGDVFILLGHVVPELVADEVGKKPWSVCGAHRVGMFGGSNERQSVGIAGANQSLGVGLGK